MKNFKKGFTLVEMLIVVVIIGILSAALLPRLQGAQSAARDSARKSDLSQLGSAILSYYNNRGEYPWPKTGEYKDKTWGTTMIPADSIREILMEVVELSSLPTDPNRSNYIAFKSSEDEAWAKYATSWAFNSNDNITDWQYWYARMKKNTIKNGWYLLIARTETEWWSNFLSTIWVDPDLKNFKTCNGFQIVKVWEESTEATGSICKYSNKGQLRYVYVF